MTGQRERESLEWVVWEHEALYVRRLHDLVHAFGTQSALDQVTDSYGSDKRGETGILALLLGGTLLEDLGRAEGRLHSGQSVSRSVIISEVEVQAEGGGMNRIEIEEKGSGRNSRLIATAGPYHVNSLGQKKRGKIGWDGRLEREDEAEVKSSTSRCDVPAVWKVKSSIVCSSSSRRAWGMSTQGREALLSLPAELIFPSS